MQIFKSILFGLVSAIVIFGFVVPYLVSAKSDVAVISGFLLILVVVYYVGYIVIDFIKEKLKEIKDNENE